MDIKWTETEELRLDEYWPKYKENPARYTPMIMREMFRGRSMAALSKKYWARNGCVKIEKGDYDQIRFDFAEQKIDHQSQ